MTASLGLLEGLFAGARSDGRRLAISDGSNAWTRAELAARVSGLASEIDRATSWAGGRVALFASRSAPASAGFLAATIAGGCVPIPGGSPAERAASILRSCQPSCALVADDQRALAETALAASGLRLPIVVLDAPTASESTPLAVDDGDLAYVLYTSGSTGTPKGVAFDHGAAGYFPRWCVERYGLTPDDRVAALAPLHFDLSTFDLFAATTAGASVHVPPYETLVIPSSLLAWLEAERITVIYAVPSLFAALWQRAGLRDGALANLRLALFAGEPFATPMLARWMKRLPHATFENLYGPTETNVCTAYRVPRGLRENDAPIPIGAALPHFETRIEDTPGEPGVGELVASGPGVMVGYWGEQWTAPGAARVHATGDLVRRDANGEFHLLGRRDRMVKIRGHRVEPAEIEGALASLAGVLEVAVVPRTRDGETILRAYYAADVDPGERALRRHCQDRVPGYMVPTEFVRVAKLPRTGTGKLALEELRRDAEGRT